MSLESWEEEFYPVSAAQVAQTGTDLELAKHCLRKWKGARPRNLRKHGIRRDLSNNPHRLCQPKVTLDFWFGSESCALCQLYIDNGDCEGCPLPKQMGQNICGDYGSPFQIFTSGGSPEPMIRALTACVKELAEKKELTRERK